MTYRLKTMILRAKMEPMIQHWRC